MNMKRWNEKNSAMNRMTHSFPSGTSVVLPARAVHPGQNKLFKGWKSGEHTTIHLPTQTVQYNTQEQMKFGRNLSLKYLPTPAVVCAVKSHRHLGVTISGKTLVAVPHGPVRIRAPGQIRKIN